MRYGTAVRLKRDKWPGYVVGSATFEERVSPNVTKYEYMLLVVFKVEIAGRVIFRKQWVPDTSVERYVEYYHETGVKTKEDHDTMVNLAIATNDHDWFRELSGGGRECAES